MYENFYKKVTGFDRAYHFQTEIAEVLLKSKKVALQAPTGSGKTYASIVPFLYATENKLPFPKRLIYIVPRRVLANSLYTSIKENGYIKAKNIRVTIQTGEKKDDPYFLKGDIIFTTIDQFLSSVLCIPFSLSKRQGNINAAILHEAYLVFDEFHLLEPDNNMFTTYHLLKKYRGHITACVMTATMTEVFFKKISKAVGMETVAVNHETIRDIASQLNTRKLVRCCDEPLTGQRIISLHKGQTIVISNRVKWIQRLYLETEMLLKESNADKEIVIICLHAQMTEAHRHKKEELLREAFKGKKNVILFSTQVIEVGLDISSTVMHTYISDINSFLQRIGRLARKNGEGTVYVYDVQDMDEPRPYLPYDRDISQHTWRLLKDCDGLQIDYFKGQEMIDAVLEERDKGIIEEINSKGDKIKEIINCRAFPERRYASGLIRDIDTVSVIVCGDPASQLADPYKTDTIPVNRQSLINSLKKHCDFEGEGWLVKAVREASEIYDWEDNKFSYETIAPEDINIEPVIVVNEQYISYSEKIGLNFMEISDGEALCLKYTVKEVPKYNLCRETYAEHIGKMLEYYEQSLEEKYELVFLSLEKQLKIDVSLDEVIRFIIIWHDTGKLDKEWQGHAHRIQRQKGDPVEEHIMLAHTDDAGERLKKTHSGAGACIAGELIEAALNKETLNKAVTTSILRHHAQGTKEMEKFQILPEGVRVLMDLTKEHCPGLYARIPEGILKEDKFWSRKSTSMMEEIINFDNTSQSVLYFIFVRILRLCDQNACKGREK